jgi:hypothetical protein
MTYIAAIALLLGVLIGFARGGSLVHLTELRLRFAWVIAIVFLAQAILFSASGQDVIGNKVAWVLTAGNLALLGVMAANWHVAGIKLFGLGLAMNALVMILNGGYMPVSEPAMHAAGLADRVQAIEDVGHSQKSRLIDETTTLGFLGDVIPVLAVHKVFAVGDFVIGLGVVWLVAAGMGTRTRATIPTPLAVSTTDGSER